MQITAEGTKQQSKPKQALGNCKTKVNGTSSKKEQAPASQSLHCVKPLTIDLRNASCFDFLKSIATESVELVLIDPPYEISRPTGFQSCGEKGVERFSVSMDFGSWDKNFTGMDEVVRQCHRVLRKGGTFICFYDLWKLTTLKDHMDEANFKQVRFIEWIKTNPVPINSKTNYLTNAREIAVVGVKGGKPTFNGQYDNGIYRHPICHEKGRFHPTQKPLALIEELIKKHSKPGDRVLDCFSGSGTTAHACIQSDRNFLGCELDTTYYRKSVARLEGVEKHSVKIIKG